MIRKPVVGVMGASVNDALTEAEASRVKMLAEDLGAAVAGADCLLITGATTGVPAMVANAFRKNGGFAVGVSPAENRRDHLLRFGLPDDGADVFVYTGFGYKGRNVVNVRSSDIVLIFGGAIGTLNEFTIAYDEGKIVGVLEESGGVADHVREIIEYCKKPTAGTVIFDRAPISLVRRCLEVLRANGG
jgi:uncharacterized protein (TIGR00725 family)